MSCSGLKGVLASWQRALYRQFFLSSESESRLMRALVLRMALRSLFSPYLAFSTNASARQIELFSQLPASNMISANASFSTGTCPSLMQASSSSSAIFSSISRTRSPIWMPISRLYLTSKLYSSSNTLAGGSSPSPTISCTLPNRCWASALSFSSMARSSSLRMLLSCSPTGSLARKLRRHSLVCLQSALLRMVTTVLTVFSVRGSSQLYSFSLSTVCFSSFIFPCLMWICTSSSRILILQFFKLCSLAVSYSVSSSVTACPSCPFRTISSISKNCSSTVVSTSSSGASFSSQPPSPQSPSPQSQSQQSDMSYPHKKKGNYIKSHHRSSQLGSIYSNVQIRKHPHRLGLPGDHRRQGDSTASHPLQHRQNLHSPRHLQPPRVL